MFNCPKCQKAIKTKKSLARHLAKQHPDYKPDGLAPIPNLKPPGSGSPAVLEIKEPPRKEKKETIFPGPQNKYHCIDCAGVITKGQSPCPHCGTELDWSGVQ